MITDVRPDGYRTRERFLTCHFPEKNHRNCAILQLSTTPSIIENGETTRHKSRMRPIMDSLGMDSLGNNVGPEIHSLPGGRLDRMRHEPNGGLL